MDRAADDCQRRVDTGSTRLLRPPPAPELEFCAGNRQAVATPPAGLNAASMRSSVSSRTLERRVDAQ